MNLQKKVENLLPDKEKWEWHEGARYRIKQVKNSVWYGLQVQQKGDQIEAKPIIAEKGNRVNIIQSNLPFSTLDVAFDQLENTKQNALLKAESPRNPHNPIHLRNA